MGSSKKATEYKIDRWETPQVGGDDPSAVRAHISGRPTGFLAAIANALGMGRTLEMRVTGESVVLDTGSLSYSGRTNIPLRSLSSISAGRSRPILLPAVLCMFGVLSLGGSMMGDDGTSSSQTSGTIEGGGGDSSLAVLFALALIGLGVFVYLRGGRLAVSVVETGGPSLGFRFRPTTAGGVTVDERAAFALCDLTVALALGKEGSAGQSVTSLVPSNGSARAPSNDPALVPSNDPALVPSDGSTNGTPPGWYTDPSDPSGRRYWSGTEWTDQTASA